MTTITNTDIEQLRTESGTAGDIANAIMCSIALGEELTEGQVEYLTDLRESDIASDRHLATHLDGLTAADARREAEAQIKDARRVALSDLR
jgi:hypothetical protein